ncbi:MAG TPA: GDSL-type esterase/lipase family protein, partial [Solirubrobacterales bacterium]|nr:GDSL-type esterase/lipase family protein [Solirubrobacterales bacterium]
MLGTSSSRVLIATLLVMLLAPAASAGGQGGASFEWGMPSRFGWNQDERGRIVEAQPHEVREGPWTVYLRVTGRACAPGADHEWRRDGEELDVERVGPCRYAARFPREGEYTVRLDATDGERRLSGVERVAVEDWLIVSIGDSVASGEAVPDVRHPLRAVWQSVRCHRSARSAHALAAKLIEADDRHSSVTFVHLACSGAGISHGLLGPYDGAVPTEEPPLEPQVSALRRIAATRPVDAVLLSAGANDTHFGDAARFCATPARDCFEKLLPPGFGGAGTRTLREELRLTLRRLPALYRRLARAISPAGESPEAGSIPPSRVYAVEYFDPTRDARGETCEKVLVSARAHELEHTRRELLEPMNAALATAARASGWRLVGGVARLFRQHGLCAGPHAWVTDLPRSFAELGGPFKGRFLGTLHPNRAGHEATATLIAAALEQDLYPGRDFPPRPLPPADTGDDGRDDGGRGPLATLRGLLLSPLSLLPALVGLAGAALGWLLWLWRESVSPYLLGFAAGALVLTAWSRREGGGEPRLSGQTFVTLARTARPLLLPVLVALLVATSESPQLLRFAAAAALLVVTWRLIVQPEAKKSGEEPRWQMDFVGKVALNTLVALGVGFALVLLAKLAGLTHPYFRALDDVPSGLFLV